MTEKQTDKLLNKELEKELSPNSKKDKKIRKKTLKIYDDLEYYVQIMNDLKSKLEIELKTEKDEYNKSLQNKIDNIQPKESDPIIKVTIISNARNLRAKIRLVKTQINFLFNKINEFSEKHNYYWHNCPISVYKRYYKILKSNFLRNNLDIIDFFEEELNFYNSPKKTNLKFYHNTFIFDFFIHIDYTKFLYEKNLYQIKSIDRNKILFLKSELKKEGYKTEIINGKYTLEEVEVVESQKPKITPEQDLTSELLPKINLQTRYEILEKLGIAEKFKQVKCDHQRSRNKILAIVMNISPDNAKHLMNDSYHPNTDRAIEKFKTYLKSQSIDLKQFE